eukprot:Protomagalhaensia_wolfi_Nauph_80__523@NODE_1296_length_1606_cov_25_201659_g1001_i0_p2_GENE_NODE_1296_length_1606_cov_25_201659_g1001_i0NODE_1296_length_1606_cov_25_201659_g1001_i0_p2_ORF_typecomplete_len137_score13_51TPR_MalT/PF17874_1/7_6e07TPR_2/PF07719_17/4e05TPR_2/PF07719_17/3_1e02TPR_16/PF13432_6/0_00053TPR_16/PF13432_6/60TPR_12/PF13424_6/0_013TPR_12/PF13424_6/40TPR_1/PF00515_28/0_0018TPR_1/PF00515_28/1_2e02TPR_7/PF13176_6/0_022TPR_7/PF13176_6/3_9e02TPR_11/PF13414_6/0_032TPR_11/PF13414_6/1_
MYGRSSDNKRRAFGIDNIEPAVVEPSRLTPAETASQEGDLYYSAGQLEDALICYKKAQQVDTIPVLCMAKEAAMYLCQGKYDEYTNACDRALVRVKKAVQDADKRATPWWLTLCQLCVMSTRVEDRVPGARSFCVC